MVSWAPTNMNNRRAGSSCVCSRCALIIAGFSQYHLSFLSIFFLPSNARRLDYILSTGPFLTSFFQEMSSQAMVFRAPSILDNGLGPAVFATSAH